jgi:hypothetical protein
VEYFDLLGDQIGVRWRAHNCDERRFPEVAMAALQELPPDRHISAWDVAKNAITATRLPQQADPDSSFGDPPLTVYTGRGFYIDVLFWTQGIPAIHQHAFSGAFHVLYGETLHSIWTFETSERIETRLLLGKTIFKSAELLGPGDSREILPGNQMIHSTFHLAHPSVTVVVRTSAEPEHQPQYLYLPPRIAYAPDKISLIERQAELLFALAVSGRYAEYCDVARIVCGFSDAYSIFKLLSSTLNVIREDETREILLVEARRRNPSLVDALEPVLNEMDVGKAILRLRGLDGNSPGLNYFLALLHTVPERRTILELIRKRYPAKDPFVLVIEWIRELSDSQALGLRFAECWYVALEDLLNGLSTPQILSGMIKRCTSGMIPTTEGAVRELTSSLKCYWLLKPLFLDRNC